MVEIMKSVENEGMKLYKSLGQVAGGQSEKLQESLEDFGTYGTYIYSQSLKT